MCAHGSRVVQVTSGLGKADHRGAASGAGGDLVERLDRLRDERGPQEKVFGWIPGDRELRKHHQIGTGGLGGVIGVDDPLGVAGKVADDDVDLGGGDAQARHTPRI